MDKIILPVPGDSIMPRLVSDRVARMVSWKDFSESPVRVVMPMAPWEVWVST